MKNTSVMLPVRLPIDFDRDQAPMERALSESNDE